MLLKHVCRRIATSRRDRAVTSWLYSRTAMMALVSATGA
jgi:hypothetical protein